MPTTVNANSPRQAPPQDTPQTPREPRRIAVPDTFAHDMRELGVIPRPLRDAQGQLLAAASAPNHALKSAVETYQKPQPADEHEFYDVICPVELEPTTHPVQMGDGHTYHRDVAQELIKDNKFRSPITREEFRRPKPAVSKAVQDLALYGHLVRHGDWSDEATNPTPAPLPALPSQRRMYGFGAIAGASVTALAAGISTGVSVMMRNNLPTLQLPACGLGDCGNVATQSYGSSQQNHTVGITGTNVAWSLLNAVNTSGQAAVDACRAAAQVCWASHVPLIQAFEKQADDHEHSASMMPYIGTAIGVGTAAVVLAGTWAYARHANRVARRARTEARHEAKAANKAYVAAKARAEKMLQEDLAELRSKQAAVPLAGSEIELMPLSREGALSSGSATSELPEAPAATRPNVEGADASAAREPVAEAAADAAEEALEAAAEVAGPSHSEAAQASEASSSTGALSAGGQRRLQRDLRELEKNEAHYPGISAGPVGDNLSIWDAKIALVDGPLAQSGKEHGIDAITLRVVFPNDYPMAPPLVLVVEPKIKHDFNYNGALCADILTPQHWQPTYTIGKLLVQLGEFLHAEECNPKVLGPGKYDLKAAERFFQRSIVKPNIFGWKH